MAELTEGQTTDRGASSPVQLLVTPQPWQQAHVLRQMGLIVMLALAVAAGVGVALWSKDPNYVPIYNELREVDAQKVTDALKTSGVDYRIEPTSGLVLVPANEVQKLRMQMSAAGISGQVGPMGMEILMGEQDLSTSQFVESKRYLHALETELSRSIMSLQNVKSARVHLAIPKQSVFVRNREKPSASVVLNMHPGRVLEEGQVASIAQLVSSSVALMEASQVTIVDQNGRLMTRGGSSDMADTVREFDYRRKLEDNYAQRIETLLEPIVGFGKVRAQVTANLDFTREESTTEAYDPNKRVVRSEKITTDLNSRTDIAEGVPGALSNQPPGAGTTDPEAARGLAGANGAESESRNEMRNFELDKTISRTQKSTGQIQRLAIAVVVDDKMVKAAAAADGAAADGESTPKRAPYTDEEITQLTDLVKEAIGFDDKRGDSVRIMNRSFLENVVEPMPEPPIWEAAWFQQLIKQLLAGIFILIIVLKVAKPIINGLLHPAVVQPEEPALPAAETATAREAAPLEGELRTADGSSLPRLEWDENGRPIDPDSETRTLSYENSMKYARIMVEQDPARAANLIKSWINAKVAS